MKNILLKNKKLGIKGGLLFSALLFVTLILCTACPHYVALGGSVDVLPPSGEILYPDAGETPIRGSFVLKGTAKDDEGVQAVSIVFENIETKERKGPFYAELSERGAYTTSWTTHIDNESTGTEAPPHELVKIYPVPDGEYTAIVTVTDSNGKTSSFTKNYKIDNTPPVFIVSRPSTIINESAVPSSSDQADGYGAVFSVVGQAGERNTVEKLNVLVSGIEPMTNMFVGNNINAQVAVYTTVPSTNALYALQAQDKTMPIRGQLYLYDNAREYTGGNASGEGNKADWYYLWDAVYTDVIAKGYTPEVISDYFAGKRGSNKDDHDKKIKELRGDAVALDKLKSAMIKMSEKRSTFKLEPSKSPGFRVIGVKNMAGSSLNVSQASSLLFKSGSETAFSVELIRNKDNTSLVGGSDLAAYKASNIEIVLLKWNGTGTAEESFKKGINLDEKLLVKFHDLTAADMSRITVENGNLRIKCIFNPSWGEGKYAVKVKGTDTITDESHTFQAYDDSNSVNGGFYIINFLAVGTGPRIRPIRPQGFKNTTLDIEADVTGIDSTGTVYYNIDAEVPPTGPYPATVLTKVAPSDQNDPRYKAANVNISGLNDGDHTIHFLVRAGSGSTDTDKTDFTVDKTAPTVALTYPEATDPQAGEITVSGSISDAGAGVKATSTKYILGKKTDAPTITTPDAASPTDTDGWKAMDNSTKGSWNIRINLDSVPTTEHGAAVGAYKKIPLYIFTEDEIGNKAVRELEILFNPDGTKPVVKVLSPQQTSPTTTLGGTIQIFGTASAATGGPGAVGEVYIQFSHNGNFANTADGTFGSTDWYNGGNGRLVPGTDTDGGADWRISINGDGSFNHATAQNQDVYFRVRAKNKNGIAIGEWTEPIKIIVDKSAPTIGSPNAIKIDDASSTDPAGGANAKDYTPNMWIGRNKKLIGSLKDDSGLKAVQIISTGLAGGVNYDLTAAQSAGWITSVSGRNYELQIPLNLDVLSQSAKNAGEFSITISITENTVTPALSTQQTFTFRFDTTDPIGDFGTDKHMNIGNFTSSSITDTQLAQKVRELGGSTSSGSGCKILAENSVLTVTKVTTGNKVEFTASPALTAGSYNYILYKPETLIYEGSGGWIINGVANDSGSGVKEVKAKVTVNGVSSPEVTMTETDPQNRITKQLGGTVTWQGKIDLSSVPDGKGKIRYTITDKSGNAYSRDVDVQVKNKPIKISKVTLKTKIGGVEVTTGTMSPAETDPQTTVTKTEDAELNQTVTVVSSNFAFKSETDSKIKVEFTGGEGTVKYRLKKGAQLIGSGYTGATDELKLKPLPNDNEIILTEDDLTAIGNSNGTPTTITLELWDEAHGFTQGTTSAFAKINITTLFDALDTTPPTVDILPFHWNSEADNSLYKNKTANGHVEIAKIDKDLDGSGPGTKNSYSSVSGKVSISGFAYDNVKINSIKAVLPNTSALTVTATRSGSTWTSDKTMAAEYGAELTVETLGADYLGYYVKWRLVWDSEKTSVGVAKDITVSANDGTNNSAPSDSAANTIANATVTRGALKSAENGIFQGKNQGQFVMFKNGETQYLTRIASITDNTVTLDDSIPVDATEAYIYGYKANRPTVKVNVVPYITSIENETGEGLDNSVVRGSDGTYSMNYSATEKMIVKGFNLKPASGGTTTATIGSSTPEVSDVTENSIKVSKKAGSGELVLTVGTVESINNKVDANKPYNKEKDITNPSSNLWNAKRKLVSWENKQVCTSKTDQTFYYPSMVMAGNQPIFAYCNNNEGYTYRTTGDDATTKRGGRWYARNAVLAKTSDSSYMILSNEDNFDTGQNCGYLYLNSKDVEGGARIGQNYPSPSSFIELCSASYGNSGWQKPSLNRFKYPSLIVNGNQTNAQIYISYYDSKEKEIRFFAFKINAGGSNIGTEADSLSSSPRGLANGTLAVPGTAGGKSSEHTAMAKIGDGIYIAYYDASSTTLKLAYSKAPTHSNGLANTTATWSTLVVDSSPLTGQHVSMAASGTKLFIAYHDAANSALKFAVVETAGTVSVTTPVIVDAYQSVGYKTGITTVNGLPYISYYNNAQAGTKSTIKVAYPKDAAVIGQAGAEESGAFTGNWITMYIPSISTPNVSVPEFNRVMINSYSSGTKPILAWLGDPFIEYTKMR